MQIRRSASQTITQGTLLSLLRELRVEVEEVNTTKCEHSFQQYHQTNHILYIYICKWTSSMPNFST